MANEKEEELVWKASHNPVYWSEKEDQSLKIFILHWRYLFSILVSDWHTLFAKSYEETVTSKMPLV